MNIHTRNNTDLPALPNPKLSPLIMEVLTKNKNIIDIININVYSNNFESLQKYLSTITKDKYNSNDLFVFVDIDTHYRLPRCPYDLDMFNFVKTIVELDIPFNNILIFTKEYGLKNEIFALINDISNTRQYPLIIDDFMLFQFEHHHTINRYNKVDIINNIKYHMLCLLGKQRVHRVALFNFFVKNKLLDKIITAYNAPKKFNSWHNKDNFK